MSPALSGLMAWGTTYGRIRAAVVAWSGDSSAAFYSASRKCTATWSCENRGRCARGRASHRPRWSAVAPRSEHRAPVVHVIVVRQHGARCAASGTVRSPAAAGQSEACPGGGGERPDRRIQVGEVDLISAAPEDVGRQGRSAASERCRCPANLKSQSRTVCRASWNAVA